MRILFICQYNPFYENGALSNRLRDLISGMKNIGHIVDIAVVGGYISASEKNNNHQAFYLSTKNHYSYWQSRLNTYIFDNCNIWYVKRRLNKMPIESYDYVWLCNDLLVFSLFLRSKRLSSVKSFIELNEYNDFYKEKNFSFLQRRRYEKTDSKFKKVAKRIDCFAVMTTTLIEHYRKMAKLDAQFLHLPMTVDFSRFQPTIDAQKADKPYVGFCGCMDKSKDGVDILIRAFIKIAPKYDINLLLAGYYTYDTDELLKLISENQLETRIKYLGPKDREDIPAFISNATVLALSRPDSHQAQGGFPTKLGEYLATGKPVCVTKVGEIPDYLKDNSSAFMAIPGDVDSFADALDRALSDPDNAKRIGLNGYNVAKENFDSEFQTIRLATFLKGCQNN